MSLALWLCVAVSLLTACAGAPGCAHPVCGVSPTATIIDRCACGQSICVACVCDVADGADVFTCNSNGRVGHPQWIDCTDIHMRTIGPACWD